MRTFTLSRLFFVALVLALLGAACGGDDESSQAVAGPLGLPTDCTISSFAPVQDEDPDIDFEDELMEPMQDDEMGEDSMGEDSMSEDGMGDMEDADMSEDGMGEMDMDMGEMDMDMGDMDMNMGERCITPAAEAGGELKSAAFELLDLRPKDDYDNLQGRVEMAIADNGTTVTLQFTGLLPNTEFISHVHADKCSENGGLHYQYEVGGSDMPPNEIHLAFTSDADGNGYMSAFNHTPVDDRATAVVVHPIGLLDNKIACAEF